MSLAIEAHDLGVYRQLVWAHVFDTGPLAPNDDRLIPALSALESFCRLLDEPFERPSFPNRLGSRRERDVLYPKGAPKRIAFKSDSRLEGYATLALTHDALVLTTIISSKEPGDAAQLRAMLAAFPEFKRGNAILLDDCFYCSARTTAGDAAAFVNDLLGELEASELVSFDLASNGGPAFFAARDATLDNPAFLVLTRDAVSTGAAAADVLNEALPDIARFAAKIRDQYESVYEDGLREALEATAIDLARGLPISDDLEEAEHTLAEFAERYRRMSAHLAKARRIRGAVDVNLRNIQVAAERVNLTPARWIARHIELARSCRDQLDIDLGYYTAHWEQARAELDALQLRLALARARTDRDTEDRNLVLTFWISIFGLVFALSGLIDNTAAVAIHEWLFKSPTISASDHGAIFSVRLVAILVLGAATGALAIAGAPLWHSVARALKARLNQRTNAGGLDQAP